MRTVSGTHGQKRFLRLVGGGATHPLSGWLRSPMADNAILNLSLTVIASVCRWSSLPGGPANPLSPQSPSGPCPCRSRPLALTRSRRIGCRGKCCCSCASAGRRRSLSPAPLDRKPLACARTPATPGAEGGSIAGCTCDDIASGHGHRVGNFARQGGLLCFMNELLQLLT